MISTSSTRRRAEPGLKWLEASFWVACAVLYAAILLRVEFAQQTAPGDALGIAAIRIMVPALLILLALRIVPPATRTRPLHQLLRHTATGLAVGVAVAFVIAAAAGPTGTPSAVHVLEGAFLYLLVVLAIGVYRGTRHDQPLVVQLSLDLPIPASDTPAPLAHLTVHEHGRTRHIPAEEVSWIQAAGKHALVHAGRRVHRVRAPMRELERRLDPARFARVHRSRIVNLERIETIRPWLHGDYRIVMEDGTVVNFSRRYRSRLLHV